jgi:hypothetical protein
VVFLGLLLTWPHANADPPPPAPFSPNPAASALPSRTREARAPAGFLAKKRREEKRREEKRREEKSHE